MEFWHNLVKDRKGIKDVTIAIHTPGNDVEETEMANEDKLAQE
jgi:hypothetical protein